jgi:hypothetical protein
VAAPIADFIQLPTDTGNTGKKVRTQTRVVGANTVHEHFFIPISARSRLGVYLANSGILTVPAAAQNGTTTGLWWWFNPVGAVVKGALRRLQHEEQTGVVAVDLAIGEARASLFTFTGTASGAQVTPGKRDSTDAAPVVNIRTASTGLTVTLVATIYSELMQVLHSATAGDVQQNPIVGNEWDPQEDGQVVIRAGEGVVEWSAVAVTTGNRRMLTNLAWEEFE